jgi:hypothetical protein
MRADIQDGSELNLLQSEAGYIDARPHPPDRRNLLPRTAGPYIGSHSLAVLRLTSSNLVAEAKRFGDRRFTIPRIPQICAAPSSIEFA